MSKGKENAGEKITLSTGIKNTAYLLGYVRCHVPALFYTNIMTGILWGYLNVASSVLVIKVVFDMIGEGRPFIDVCKFLLMMSMILLPVLGIIYFCDKRLWPVLKLKLGKSLHAELFLKAQKVDLRCYDDARFYTSFIWTVREAEDHVYRAVNNMGSVLLHVLACLGVIAIMLEIDPIILVIAVASMVLKFLFRLLKTRIEFLREQRLMPLVKKYEYISRVFYMPDYAKELRMSRIDRLLTEEFDDCVSKMDTVYRRLQFRLTVLEIGEQVCNVFLTNAFLIFVLVYKIFIVKSVSVGDLSVSIAAEPTIASPVNASALPALSGGEAQKIAIARAFLKDPHTYILDEPSSALDPISEYNLNRTLFELSKDRTVIFISHRLSTTRMAEQIYMMEKGRIIEAGNHEELLARGAGMRKCLKSRQKSIKKHILLFHRRILEKREL